MWLALWLCVGRPTDECLEGGPSVDFSLSCLFLRYIYSLLPSRLFNRSKDSEVGAYVLLKTSWLGKLGLCKLIWLAKVGAYFLCND